MHPTLHRRGVIVCLLLWCLPVAAAQAQTIPGPFYWPEGYLPANGHIFVSGNLIGRTGHSHGNPGPYLVGESDTAALRLVRTFCGSDSDNTCTFEFAPTTPLRPGSSYTLVQPDSGSTGSPATALPTWTVLDRNDTVAPEWAEEPAYIGGCDRYRTSHYAYAALSARENGAMIVEVALVSDEAPGDTLRYLFVPRREIVEQFSDAVLVSETVRLKLDSDPGGYRVSVPDRTILPIGNGIYGGSLEFRTGRRYRISMQLIDAAGNVSGDMMTGTLETSQGPPLPTGNREDLPTAGGTVNHAPAATERGRAEETGAPERSHIPAIPTIRFDVE